MTPERLPVYPRSVIELNLRPDPSQVRWFGALWLPGSLAVAGGLALARWNLPAPGWALLAAAVLSEVSTWIAPALVRMLLVAVNVLTWPMAWLTNHLLLAALYFGLLSPLGLALRAFSRRQRPAASYWIDREPAASVDRYFRPY